MRSAGSWRTSHDPPQDDDEGEDFHALFAALLGKSSSTHGRLETRHVKPVLEFLGFELTAPEMTQMLQLMDANGDGFVTVADFVSSMAPLNDTSAASFEADALERPWAVMSNAEDLMTIRDYRRAADKIGAVFHSATDAESKLCLQVIAKLAGRALDGDGSERAQGDVNPSLLGVRPELEALAKQHGSNLRVPAAAAASGAGSGSGKSPRRRKGSFFSALARVSPNSVAEASKQHDARPRKGLPSAQKAPKDAKAGESDAGRETRDPAEGRTFVTKRVSLRRPPQLQTAAAVDDDCDKTGIDYATAGDADSENVADVDGGGGGGRAGVLSPAGLAAKRRTRPNSAVQVVNKSQFEVVLRGGLDDKTIEKWMRYRI